MSGCDQKFIELAPANFSTISFGWHDDKIKEYTEYLFSPVAA